MRGISENGRSLRWQGGGMIIFQRAGHGLGNNQAVRLADRIIEIIQVQIRQTFAIQLAQVEDNERTRYSK